MTIAPITVPTIDSEMQRLQGIAHLQDLLAAGFTRARVAKLHRAGWIQRPRIGWYVANWHSPEVVRAVRVGGVLGCVSAMRSFGCAVPSDGLVHVALPGNAARLRSSADGFMNVPADETDVVRHWGSPPRVDRYRVDPLRALDHVLGCVEPAWAVGVVDAARRPNKVDPRPLLATDRLADFRAGISVDKRRILDLSTGRAESILESVARVKLRAAGLEVEEQVAIGGYRADLVVEGWLVIECDGYEHHSSREAFEYDRVRDAALVAAGFRVLHLSYRRVVEEWDAVLADVRRIRASIR